MSNKAAVSDDYKEGDYRPDLDDGLKIMRLEGNPCPEGRIENFMDNPYLQMKRGELEVGMRES